MEKILFLLRKSVTCPIVESWRVNKSDSSASEDWGWGEAGEPHNGGRRLPINNFPHLCGTSGLSPPALFRILIPLNLWYSHYFLSCSVFVL